MGVYLYTLRTKTIPVILPTGEKVRANLLSYAYKFYSMWPGDYGYRSYKLMEANAARHALNAWNTPHSGYVIVGDAKDDHDDATLWAGLKSHEWVDCEKFPADHIVGFLKKVGKVYHVKDTSNWCNVQSLRDGTWVPTRHRYVMVDGKPKYESEDLPCNPEAPIS